MGYWRILQLPFRPLNYPPPHPHPCFQMSRMEGFSVSHTQAIRLIQLALQQSEYGLVGDLLRFILPPSKCGSAPFILDPQQSVEPESFSYMLHAGEMDVAGAQSLAGGVGEVWGVWRKSKP